MEAVNGVAAGPPPPSPLTGCYLLVVLGEPHTGSHKDIILQRLAKGLLSWNVNDCLVDLEKELTIVTEQGLEGEEARYGERLIQFASENLVTEILIHPSVSTLVQCVRNLLSSFTRHRHIIHAGYTFAANGSWILQDGTFSLADFSEAFQEIDVQRVIRAYENGISFDIHCSPEGEWMKLPKESFTRGCKLRVNPDDVLDSGSPAIANFVNYISPFLIPAELENILESSDVVGNIRFSRPTLYVFPGGQGDAALFGINGFNMLVDGGFSRKACFWDFVRHLDRLDAVMLTRLNNSNANGIGAVLRRKAQNAVYPQIGHFFCNIQNRKANLSPDGDKDKDPLVVNLLEEGQELISNLRSLELNPQLCYRDSEPINLYHKVGHGTLDMYVINPAKDSREVKEFLLRWNSNDHKLFANHKFSRECMLPLQNIVSICALLVWRPANPNDTITRILFPGSAPQNKIFEGLDRLKNLECIKHTVCTERTLAPPPKLKSKENILDRIVPPEKPKSEMKRNKPRQTPENKLIEDNLKNGLQNGHAEKTVKKSGSIESDKSESKPPKPKREENKLTESNKQEKEKIQKSKPDTNGVRMRQKPSEKKPSPPTPKKTVDTKKTELDKETTNQRVRSKVSPSATPAKSTKDATNRRVLDKSRTAPKREVKEAKQTEKKEEPKKVERKPISRRPKTDMKLPQSPVKRAINGTHKPDSISRKGKLDRDVTTDSSTVSTPSVDQDTLLKKDLSKLTPEEVQQLKAQELAELKEEQEAIKELEAVFRKGDKISEGSSDLRKVKDISIEDKTDTEEYLIVEKEVIEPSQPEESEADAKEEETVKLARDSEESEKKRDESETKDDLDKDRQVDTEQEESGIGEQETDIEEGEEIQENEISKEPSIQSPEENKRIISKDEEMKEQALESQPDERVSANIESGATTTAPTLPEDERIPLNEIKEDIVDQIEEKHVKEETKEKETKEEIPVITFTTKTAENITKLPSVVGIRLDKETRIRDIVKTPDEVADLPVHEEVDVEHLTEFAHERVKSKDEIYGDSLVKDEGLTSPKKSEESQKEEEKIDAAEEKVSVVPQVAKKESEVEVTEEADKSNVKESQPLEKSPLQEEIDVHVETTIKPVEVVEKQDDTKEDDSVELKDDTREKELSMEKQPSDKKIPEEPKDIPQAILQSSELPKKDIIEEETIPKEDAVEKKETIEEIVQKDSSEQPTIDQEISSISKIKEVEEEKKESKDIDEKHEKSDVLVKDSKEEEKLETTITQLPEVESKLQKADIVETESEKPDEADEICTKQTEPYEQKIQHEDEKESTGKISEITTPVEKKIIESAVTEKKESVPEKDSPSKTQDESSDRRESVHLQKVELSGETQQEAKILPEKEMSLYSELKQEELKAEEQDKEQEKKLADEPIETALKKEKDEKSHEVDEKTSDLESNANVEEKAEKIQTKPEQSVKVESKKEEIKTLGNVPIDEAVTGMKEEKSHEIPTEKVEQSSDESLIGKELLKQIEHPEEKDDQKICVEQTIDSSQNEQDQTLHTVPETKTHTPVHSELDREEAKEERKMSISEKEERKMSIPQKEERKMSITEKEERKMSIAEKEERKMSITEKEERKMSITEKEEQKMSITEKEERKMSIAEKEEHKQKLDGEKEMDLGMSAEALQKGDEKTVSETKSETLVHSELDKEVVEEERKKSITEKEEQHKLEDKKDVDITSAESLPKEEEKSPKPISQTELDKKEVKEERKESITEKEEHQQKLGGEKELDLGISADPLRKEDEKTGSETKSETIIHSELDKAEVEETEKEEQQKLEGKKEIDIGITTESLPKDEEKSPKPISETKTEPVDHSELSKEEAKEERKMSINEKEEHQQKLEGEKVVDLGKTTESSANEEEKSPKTVSATETHVPEHLELDTEKAKEERKMSIPEKEEHQAKLEGEKQIDLGITADSLRKEEGKTTETVSETKTETQDHLEKTKEERKMSVIGTEEHQQKLEDENKADLKITADSSQHEKQDTPQTDSVSKIDPSVHSETKEERKMSVSAKEEHQQKLKDEKEAELEKSSESKTVADSERISDEKIESCETTQSGREEKSAGIDEDSSELKKSRSPSPSKLSERKSSKVEQELKQQVPDSIEPKKEEHKEKDMQKTETKKDDDFTAAQEKQDEEIVSPEKLPADHRDELKETYPERDEGKDSAEKIEVSSAAKTKEDSETASKEVASKDLEKPGAQTEEKESQQLKAEEQEKELKDTVMRSPERRESSSDQGKAPEIIPTEEERKSEDSKTVGIEEQPIIDQETKTSEQQAPSVELKEGTDTKEKTEDKKLQDDIETEKPKMISSEKDLHERKDSLTKTPEKIVEKIAPEESDDITTNLPTAETIATTKVPETPISPSSDDLIKKESITQSEEQKSLSPTDKEKSPVVQISPSEKDAVLSASAHESPESLIVSKPSEDVAQVHAKEQEKLPLEDEKLESHTVSSEKVEVKKSTSSDEKEKSDSQKSEIIEKKEVELLTGEEKSIKNEKIETTECSESDQKSEKTISKPHEDENYERSKSPDKTPDLSGKSGKSEEESIDAKSSEKKPTVDDSVEEEKSGKKGEDHSEKDDTSDIKVSSSPVQQTTPIKPIESTADSHDRKSSTVSLKEELEISQTEMEKEDKDEDNRKASIEKVESSESFLTRKFSVVHAEKEISIEADKDKESTTTSTEIKEKSPDSISSGETSTTVTTEKETPQSATKSDSKFEEDQEDSAKDSTPKTKETDEKLDLNEQKISESTSHKDMEQTEVKASTCSVDLDDIKTKEETCSQLIREGDEKLQKDISSTEVKSPKEISRTSSPLEPESKKVAEESTDDKTKISVDQVEAQTLVEEKRPSVEDVISDKKTTALETISSEKKHKSLDSEKETTGEEKVALDSSKHSVETEKSTAEKSEKATPELEVKKEIEKADEKADSPKDKPVSPVEKQSHDKDIEKVHDMEQKDNKYASMSAEEGEEHKDINLNRELKSKNEVENVIEKGEEKPVQIDESAIKTPEDTEKIEIIEKQDHETAETEKGSITKKVEEQKLQKEIPLGDIKDFLEQEKLHSHKERGSLGEIPTAETRKLDEKSEEKSEKSSNETPLHQSIAEKKEQKEDDLKLKEINQESGIKEPKDNQEETSESRPASIISDDRIMKTEKIKIDLTDKPEHAEPVLLKSTPESPIINIVPQLPVLPTDIDKAELGRKSPAEREEDVAKIVASVATVLKSDAPLEVFHKQIPLYTTELRETHITTCDSPVTEKDIHIELQQEADWKDQEAEFLKDLESSIIEDKKEQIEESSKTEEPEDSGTVHRMLVTASSEDGGEETEICPPGTIIFSRSSESSGRSSPENMSRKLSQTSSNLDTISDQTTVKELTDALSKKEPVIEEVCKSSKGVLEGARQSDKDHATQQIYPDIDLKDEVKSLEDQIEEAIRTDKRKDESKDEKKEDKRSEIQEILTEALQDVSRDAEDVKETVAGKIGNVFGSIFSGASKVSEALSHTLSDSVKAVESSIDEGLKKVESEIGEVKHKIEDAESKVVDTLVEKKEMAEHIVADHLRESVSALSDTIDKTDKAKESLVKQTEDTLDKMAAPLRETLGDALSNLAESLKHKEERSDTAHKEEKESDSKDKPTISEDVETEEFKRWVVTSGGEITQQIYPSLKDDLKNVTDEVEDTKGQISGGEKESPVDLEKPLEKVEESITSVISDATKEIEEALGKLQDTKDISSEEYEKKTEASPSKEEKKEELVKDIDQKISSTIEDLGEIVQDTKKAVVDHISDKEKSLKDEKEKKLEEVKEDVNAKVEEIKGDLVDKIEESKRTVEEKISEMEKSVTEKSENKLDEFNEKLGSTLEKSDAALGSIEKTVDELTHIISDTKEQIGDSATKAVEETVKEIEKMEKVADIPTEDSKSLKDDISGIIHDSGLEPSKESAKNIAQESKASHDTVKEHLIEKAQPTSIEEKKLKDETSESEHGKDSLLSRLETKAENMINSYTDEIKDTLSGTAEEDAKMSFESIKHDIDVKDMEKEMSELIDAESKTAQSVISEISNIVKEEIDSSLKDLGGAEKTIAQEVAKKSSDISESLKSMVDTGHSVKEETKSTIKDLGSTIAEKSEELVEKSKGEIEKKISDVKTEVEGTKTAIIEKAESVSKDIKDTKDKVEETFSETKETVEASICSIKQDLEKEKDALVSAGKEIESEVKHAVEDVFDAGKKLFGGLFGSKKSKDEKKTKEAEKISTDTKVDKEESTQSCIQKDNRVTSELSGCISSDGSDEKCEVVVKDKCDVMGTLGLGKSGDISETCDISKGDVQTHLGLDVSQEKKLSISDVEIFVDEKGEDSSTTHDKKTDKKDQKEDKSKVEIVTKEGLDDKPHIKAEDSEVGTVSSHESEIEKHITDVPRKELSSHDVQSVTSTIDAQKLPFGSEKVSDSEDDFTSQLHHKMSEQMDPMMMSFYGALPDDDRDADDGDDLSGRSEVPLTHLHDLTKAKFDGKKFSAATGGLEFPAQDPMTSSFYGELPSDKDDKDPIEAWGKPLGLPSPAPPNEKSTPKKERKLPSNVMAKNRINDDRARSESPSKNKKKINPVYVDLTYVPHHGNSNYAYVDFFKKVRARYYVFSGIEPSREVYNALLEAKQTWEDKDLEVTIIPTYDTDVLGYWVAENEELLTKYKIDLSPSASRCTINLQDHETSCSAYRLEF